MVRLGVLTGYLVPKYLELFTRIRERDFENLVYEVVISIQFVQGLFEHFQLKIKIHPYRTIEAYQPGMERNIGVLSFGTRCTNPGSSTPLWPSKPPCSKTICSIPSISS
jgi:hypothetical protein